MATRVGDTPIPPGFIRRNERVGGGHPPRPPAGVRPCTPEAGPPAPQSWGVWFEGRVAGETASGYPGRGEPLPPGATLPGPSCEGERLYRRSGRWSGNREEERADGGDCRVHDTAGA